MSVAINGTGSITGIDQGFNITSGSVGIGTDNPTAPLQINHASPKIILRDNDNDADISVASIGGAAVYSAASDIIFQTSNSSEKLRITSGGKVGIRTDNPKQIFSVVGRANFDLQGDYYGSWINGDSQGSSSFNVGAWHNAGGRMRNEGSHLVLETMNTSHWIQLQPSGGNVSVGSNNANGLLALTAASGRLLTLRNSTTGSGSGDGSYLALNGSDLQIANAESANVILYTADTERLRITSAGKLTVTPEDTTSSYATTDGGIDIAQIISSTGTSDSQSIGIQFSLTKSGQTGAIAEIGAIREGSGLSALVFRTRDNSTGRNERLRIDSTGSIFAGGSIITEADMHWGHDTYQRPHIFTGATGGNPSDGCIVLASPETNPGGTRIGSIVFGCKTSSASGVNNSGIKATIECNTNNNLSDAWKTGASITFKTRPNNGNPTAAQTIHHNGNITKPLQPAFRALSTGFSKNNNWQKITFGTENYDIGGYYDHGNNKFTAPVAGRYVFYAGGWSSSTSTDSRYAFCARVNGGGLHYLAGAHYGNVDSPMAGYSVIHNLAANDYVELWGYSAVATTWGGGSHYMFWGGYLLG